MLGDGTEFVKTREAIYNYLTEPSPLFLKQVVDIAETKAYFLVRDLRKVKRRFIPDTVITKFEYRFQHLCQHGCKVNEYDGVHYLLISKVADKEISG
jgi:hypothetical protein